MTKSSSQLPPAPECENESAEGSCRSLCQLVSCARIPRGWIRSDLANKVGRSGTLEPPQSERVILEAGSVHLARDRISGIVRLAGQSKRLEPGNGNGQRDLTRVAE